MIKIAICDDEEEATTLLSKLVKKIIADHSYNMEIVCVTHSQEEIYNLVVNNEIDVLFLDINFNDCNTTGIDLAEKLRSVNKNFYLIILTGFFEYALHTFKCKTFDYIVKPADLEKIEETLMRLNEDINSNKTRLIKFKNNVILSEDEILYIEKTGYKALIHTKNGSTYSTYGSLKEINSILPSYFMQSHRAFLINTKQITSIDKKNNIVNLGNNISCPISDSYMRDIT